MTLKQKLRVGFIGLGLMGNPMAKNVLSTGFALAVYNRSKNKTEEFKKLGAKIYSSPQELGSNVDVVITMVTGPKDVKEVLLGKDGVIFSKNTNLTIIDMSTIGPKAAIEIAKALKKKSIEFLDAPVTGSTYKAKTGELTIFIGGNQKVFEKIKPVLNAMGTNLQYMGESGSGQTIKLINNLIVAGGMAALAQGFILGDTLGLSRQKIAKALENVPALSPFMKLKLPNLVKNEFPVAFSVANMFKDLNLAVEESKKKNKKMALLELLQSFYDTAMQKNLGKEDLSAIVKVL